MYLWPVGTRQTFADLFFSMVLLLLLVSLLPGSHCCDSDWKCMIRSELAAFECLSLPSVVASGGSSHGEIHCVGCSGENCSRYYDQFEGFCVGMNRPGTGFDVD